MMQALVTGATGMLGRHLVDVLLDAGVAVRAFVRSSSDTRYLESKGVELFQGDAGDRAALRRAVERAAGEVGGGSMEVTSYLATALAASGTSVPYSTVAALAIVACEASITCAACTLA